MKPFKQFLKETPPPSDWDTGVFQKSFAQQLKYATERAAKIGTGSSRVAFIIPYEGRDTVLKIAKNAKGLAQNELESDYGLHHMHGSVLIPLIDHDQENDPPRWVHFEKADKLTAKQFQQIEGYSFVNFANILQHWEQEAMGRRGGYRYNYLYGIPQETIDKIHESELFEEVANMVANFGFLTADFARLANWGLYKGNPVIIDYGFNPQIQKQYYSR